MHQCLTNQDGLRSRRPTVEDVAVTNLPLESFSPPRPLLGIHRLSWLKPIDRDVGSCHFKRPDNAKYTDLEKQSTGRAVRTHPGFPLPAVGRPAERSPGRLPHTANLIQTGGTAQAPVFVTTGRGGRIAPPKPRCVS